MSDKKINLNSTEVESREQRLGTIIAWDGSATDLSKQSAYASKTCGQNGKLRECEICELDGPFTQGSACSEQMVACQAGQVRDAVLIEHGPIGCATGQVGNNMIFRAGLAVMNLPVKNIKGVSTNLQERDIILGGEDKLRQTIHDTWERLHPKAIFISTSCATGIIGDDVDSISEELEKELGIPVIPLHCEGFKSKHWSTGFDAAQHGILRQIVKKNPQKQSDLVNVIKLWGSDIFTPIFKELDLRPNYFVDLATVDDLAQASEAVATVGFCNTLSTYMAAALEQHFNVPEIKAPNPYGFIATDAWLRELGKVTNREEKVEAYILKEHARVILKIKELKEKLKGLEGYVATGSAYAHGVISVLKELGIKVEGSLVFHHDPTYDSGDPRQDSLNNLIKNYGDVPNFSVSNRQQYQFYALLKRVNPDFIIIRHNGLAPLASKLGIPAISLGDEHSIIGYQGIINMGEIILEVLSRRKFHLDLAEHVKLPYSKWWLSQEDPYILARNSNLPDEESV